MRWILLLLLMAGCATGPRFTYSQLQSIQPGVTTRADVLKSFGEPESVMAGSEACSEQFLYFKRVPWSWDGYYSNEYDSLNIEFTNGIVKSWFKSR